MLAVAGCGGGSAGQDARPRDLERIGLTRAVPAVVRGTCRRLAARARVRVYCPPLVPAGATSLRYSHADRDGYDVEVNTPAIHRSSAGHWAFGAVTPARLGSLLHPSTSRLEPGIAVSAARLGSVSATRYVIPPDADGGGIYRGHVVYVWRVRGTDYYLTLHGRRNGMRARAMAEALAAATRRTAASRAA